MQESHAPSQTEETPKAPASGLKGYVISLCVIAVVGVAIDLLLHALSIEHLREINDSFVRQLKQVEPFKLAALFYGYIRDGGPPIDILHIPPPSERPGFPALVLDATFYAIKSVVSGGIISNLTAFAALAFGILAVSIDQKTIRPTLLWLLAPLIGGCFVWVLLLVMTAIGTLVGSVLELAQTIAASSIAVWLFGVVIKEREHHISSSIIRRMTGR